MFYITTAIVYANGDPHLGHAYELVLTDVIARYRRMIGDDVYFLTGLDEHGQKVQQSANKLGVKPIDLCNDIASKFNDLCAELQISNNDYIRTTEDRHKCVVQSILQELYDKKEIYKDDYKGFYSVKQEQFLQEKDRIKDGSWPEELGEVIEIVESNYFFKLSQYQDWLIDFIKTHDDFIFPRFRQKQVLEFLKDPINDLCISRPVERLSWGIPLPFDPGFVTYVWFDALINYISAIKYGSDQFTEYWPVNIHVIGKDIILPAHGIYWPIMLHACGIDLPQSLLVHGFWNFSGRKMSKSRGETIDPLSLVKEYGASAFRYFFTREMNVGQDSDYSLDQFVKRYNSDLGNDLGNLVSRLLNMGARYSDRLVPPVTVQDEPEKELLTLWDTTRKEVVDLYDGMQFHTALDRTFTFIRAINRYTEIRAPWALAKSDEPDDRKRLESTLGTIAESLRLSAALLAPVTPDISLKIYQLLGMSEISTWDLELPWSSRLEGNTLGEKTILFPRSQ